MPTAADTLEARLTAAPLLLDGATGTELQRRGVATRLPLWSAAALLHAPAAVQRIHEDYVAAGADLVVANTFRTNPRTLGRAGLLERGPELNALALELARAAAGSHASDASVGRQVFVAASVAPVEDCYSPQLVPDADTLRREFEQFMSWLRAASPDLLWIETMGTVREASAAARCAQQAGLPFAVSFVVDERGDLLSHEPLEAAIDAVAPLGPLALGLNCVPPAGLTRILPRLARAASVPLCAYAHIGNPEPIRGWSFSQDVSPGDYAAHAREWLDLGARIIGGCCGTTPEHIAALRRLLDARRTRGV